MKVLLASVLLIILILLLTNIVYSKKKKSTKKNSNSNNNVNKKKKKVNYVDMAVTGDQAYDLAADLMDDKLYKDAADLYWKAVLLTTGNKVQYSLEEAYMSFMKCYQLMNKVDEGYLYIAKEYVARNDYGDNALTYINRTLEANPNNVGAYVLMLQILQQDNSDAGQDKLQKACFEIVAKFPESSEANLHAGNMLYTLQRYTGYH
jgi:tetratricopeptide (TPR) repeat protein